MTGFIYLVRDGQHVRENADVYKLGRTVQVTNTICLKRLKIYSPGTELKFVCEVPEEHVNNIEALILAEVAKNFDLFSGNEWFAGNWRDMATVAFETITEYLNDVCNEAIVSDNVVATQKTTNSRRNGENEVEPVTFNEQELKQFVNEVFECYDEKTLPTDFVIDLEVLSKWLDVRKDSLVETLNLRYKLDVDYIKQKCHHKSNRHVQILITPNCMKRLCMRSRSAKAEAVRTYFIKMFHYNEQIVDGAMREDANGGKAIQETQGDLRGR